MEGQPGRHSGDVDQVERARHGVARDDVERLAQRRHERNTLRNVVDVDVQMAINYDIAVCYQAIKFIEICADELEVQLAGIRLLKIHQFDAANSAKAKGTGVGWPKRAVHDE